MGEEMNESLPNRGPQGSAAQRGGGDGRSRPLRRSVRESAAAATCDRETPTTNVEARSREVAASLDKDLSVVAAERSQGTASSERSLFTRLQWIVRWPGLSRIAEFGLLQSPRFEAPARTIGRYDIEVERRQGPPTRKVQ